jgi:hypothetical protein
MSSGQNAVSTGMGVQFLLEGKSDTCQELIPDRRKVQKDRGHIIFLEFRTPNKFVYRVKQEINHSLGRKIVVATNKVHDPLFSILLGKCTVMGLDNSITVKKDRVPLPNHVIREGSVEIFLPKNLLKVIPE